MHAITCRLAEDYKTGFWPPLVVSWETPAGQRFKGWLYNENPPDLQRLWSADESRDQRRIGLAIGDDVGGAESSVAIFSCFHIFLYMVLVFGGRHPKLLLRCSETNTDRLAIIVRRNESVQS